MKELIIILVIIILIFLATEIYHAGWIAGYKEAAKDLMEHIKKEKPEEEEEQTKIKKDERKR